jgi:uncharacterized coiled-coil protein SlyX
VRGRDDLQQPNAPDDLHHRIAALEARAARLEELLDELADDPVD